MHDALCEPRPVQAHLPILIGGSGRQKTLRVVAERGDGWNTAGPIEEVTDALRTLERHCDEVGRDVEAIEKTVSFPIVLRDDAAPQNVGWPSSGGQRRAGVGFRLLLAGSPAEVADTLRRYLDLGFETVIVRMPAPYDRETIGGCRRSPVCWTHEGRAARRRRRRGEDGRGLAAIVGRDLTVIVNTATTSSCTGWRSGPTTTPWPTRWPGSTTRFAAGACAASRGP
jgi:hypothetical protein